MSRGDSPPTTCSPWDATAHGCPTSSEGERERHPERGPKMDGPGSLKKEGLFLCCRSLFGAQQSQDAICSGEHAEERRMEREWERKEKRKKRWEGHVVFRQKLTLHGQVSLECSWVCYGVDLFSSCFKRIFFASVWKKPLPLVSGWLSRSRFLEKCQAPNIYLLSARSKCEPEHAKMRKKEKKVGKRRTCWSRQNAKQLKKCCF